MAEYDAIVDRAAQRKGGLPALESMLPARPNPDVLASRPDSWLLGEMTRSIFQSGFVWRVIDQKWDGFCEAFVGFEPAALMRLDDQAWENYRHDSRIVRNPQKIRAFRHNLWFVQELSAQYGGFGRFLAEWPVKDLIGLFELLKKQGSRLGGNTGQYFLQRVGVDSFALTRDVVCALQLAGLEIRDNPTSRRDLQAIQAFFNDWLARGPWSYRQMSHILAYSVGDNRVMPNG